MPQPEIVTRAFQLTVSVKGDLSIECEEKLVSWIRKNTHMHHVVIELGTSNRRHMHACMIFSESRLPCKLKSNIWDRLVKPFHPDSLAARAIKVQVMPGNKWYDEYLRKEQEVQVLSSTWDREKAESFFPTPSEQESLVALAQRKGQACPYLTEDIEAWSGSTFENTPEGALAYLKHRMFVLRNLQPIADPRKRTEKAYMYWEYRNQVTAPTERELWLLKQLQDGPCYDPVCRGTESAAPPSI